MVRQHASSPRSFDIQKFSARRRPGAGDFATSVALAYRIYRPGHGSPCLCFFLNLDIGAIPTRNIPKEIRRLEDGNFHPERWAVAFSF